MTMSRRPAPRIGGHLARTRQATGDTGHKKRDRDSTRSLLSRANVMTLAVVVIAACVSWPYVRSWTHSTTRSFKKLMTAPPKGAPARPTSANPTPEEQVSLEAEWRRALEKPFRDLRAYAEQLERVEQDGIARKDWFRISSAGNSRAYQEGFRSDYDRLYSDLSGGNITLHMHLKFDSYAIEKLEADLQLLQAKLKAACSYLDREHELTMDERKNRRR